jgi:hypothetical protein
MIQHVSVDCHHCRSKGNRNDYKCPHLIPDDGSPLKHSGPLISMLLIVYCVGIYRVILVINEVHIQCVQLYQVHHRQWTLSIIHVTHKSILENSLLLGRYTVSLVLQSAMFWRAVEPSEHQEWNSNTAYHPRRLESQKCHISPVIADIKKTSYKGQSFHNQLQCNV